MLLNLGCGFRKYPDYVNVDSAPECKPDVVWDMEQTPWPFDTDSVDGIKLEHVLEHVGETTQAYINIWKEMYRVCKDGAIIDIIVPYWRHDYFYNDPTHVRPITPKGLMLFDQESNLAHLRAGDRSTKLGLFTGIDISIRDEDVVYGYDADEPAGSEIVELSIKARIVKPQRGAAWLKENGF